MLTRLLAFTLLAFTAHADLAQLGGDDLAAAHHDRADGHVVVLEGELTEPPLEIM